MKRLNVFSRFMSEVTGRGQTLRNRAVNRMSQCVSPAALLPRAIMSAVILAVMLITTLGFTPQSHAQMPGDTLVIDQDAGTNSNGALFRVNPANGNRTLVSNFSNSAQGPLGFDPVGVALDSSGNILVIDNAGTSGRGALFGVNPSGGNRIVVRDFGDPSKGVPGEFPTGVSVFTVKCGGLNATRIGNSFDNTINGTAGPDVIHWAVMM